MKIEDHPLTKRLQQSIVFYKHGLARARRELHEWERDWKEADQEERLKANGPRRSASKGIPK